eukprot:IDg16307t1
MARRLARRAPAVHGGRTEGAARAVDTARICTCVSRYYPSRRMRTACAHTRSAEVRCACLVTRAAIAARHRRGGARTTMPVQARPQRNRWAVSACGIALSGESGGHSALPERRASRAQTRWRRGGRIGGVARCEALLLASLLLMGGVRLRCTERERWELSCPAGRVGPAMLIYRDAGDRALQ